MDAGQVDASTGQGSQLRAGYRRSAGSRRGEARRRELLDRVADDLAANGLVDFSLRRAARAAGTTHKVLLYHFDGADDLLKQAILELRERRIGNVLAATRVPAHPTLAARVRAVWPILREAESGLRVLDQAIAGRVSVSARCPEWTVERRPRWRPLSARPGLSSGSPPRRGRRIHGWPCRARRPGPRPAREWTE